MPVRSMTGYGRGVAAAGGLRVEIRATSINRKQLDVQVNFAREFAELEPRLQAEVRGALSRGRVTLLVDVIRSAAVRRQEVHVDEDLAAAYHAALQKATKRLGLPDNVDATFLMSLPEVVQLAPPAQELERVWTVAQRALAAALKALVAMRTREGTALRRDIEPRLAGLEKRADQIATYGTARWREAKGMSRSLIVKMRR